MTLELRNRRHPVSAQELSWIESEQLVAVGVKFDGRLRSAESRLRDEPIPDEDGRDGDDGNFAAHGLVAYEAWEGDRHLYDVWTHHGGDNGCVFLAGTMHVLAGRFQDAWREPDGSAVHPLNGDLHAAEAAL